MSLVLHPHTKRHVAQFAASPSHAVLLVGSNGIGKLSLAQTMVAKVLGLEYEKLASHPYFTIVRSDKDSISIDAVRELQRFLQLKTLGNGKLRRAAIIEHAERLTIEAQNAFLKLLEEPPEDTLMVLAADNQRGLLPTILSRTQLLTVYAPAEADLKQHFAQLSKDGAAINQAYLLSGGLPGLMHALLENDQSHPLMIGVATAKEVLQKSTFERLAMVEPLSKQKEDAKYMLEALQHIAQTMLDTAAGKADQAKVKQWFQILRTAATAREALSNNANAKLVLDNVMLSL